MKVEFIHCGDLHLGCNSERIEERFNDFFVTFEHVVEYTAQHKIKYLLISGDFFHLKVLNSKTLKRAIKILQKAKKQQIKVIVIEGNHDKAFYVDEESWLNFLAEQDYITLLSSSIVNGEIALNPYKSGEGAIYETAEVRIIGLSYLGATTQKYLEGFAKILPERDKPTILMLHAAVDRLGGQDLGDVKKEVLYTLADKVNYVALGHIHNQYEYNNFLFNPGSLENIRIKDGEFPEKKGFYRVVIDNDVVNAQHIESVKRKVYIKRIEASSYLNPNDFISDVIKTPFDFVENSCVILQIWGKVDYNALTFDTKLIAEQIKKRYNLLYIDVINSVNILKSASEGKAIDIDISSLVKDEVINSISFHYPDTNNKEDLARQMMRMATDITDGRDFSDIIARLDIGGEK